MKPPRPAEPDYRAGGLLRYQRGWVHDPAPVAIMVKSRQIGITYATAFRALLLASPAKHASSHYYLSHTEDVGREFIGDVVNWCRATEQIVSHPREQVVRHPEGDYRVLGVTFANGRVAMALPGIARALRGRRGHVVIDEAAYLDDLPGIVKAAGAMLMRGWTIRIISTHHGRGDFHAMHDSAEERGWRKLTLPLSLAIRQGLYRQIAASLGKPWSVEAEQQWEAALRRSQGDSAPEEFDCIPAEDGTLYLPGDLVAQRMVACPIVREAWKRADVMAGDSDRTARILGLLQAEVAPVVRSVIRGRRRYLGWDVARDPQGDPICGVVIEETHQGRYQPLVMLEFRGLPYDQQRDVIDWLWEALGLHGVAVDATGIGATVGEHCELKWPERGHAIRLNRPWYAEHLPVYKDDLEAGRMLIPRHQDVQNDHRLVEVEKGAPRIAERRIASSDGGQRHADSVIALALARYAAGQDPHYPDWTEDAVQSARPGAIDEYDPHAPEFDEDAELEADPWAV